LKKSKAAKSLPAELLRQKLAKFPANVRAAAAEISPGQTEEAAALRANLQSRLERLKGGDIRRGQALFNSTKTACVSCHAIGYVGGKVGPDLTTIGTIRTEVDLLEAIIYPSASFVRSYEPVLAVTKDGETHSGILRGDNDDAITLVAGPNLEERIARADIAELRPGALSIMPAGLDTQLNDQELADLVAFLKGTKWGAN
jgi:putative heme-binding domain-containing protein